MKRALIIQSAFLGDVVLALPLVQALKRAVAGVQIDFVAIPQTAEILRSHPDIAEVITYDKHGKQKSLSAFLALSSELANRKYDFVLSPHRSLRSCFLVQRTKAAVRVGFDKSSMKRVFTHIQPWKFGMHEIERNLSLLKPLGIQAENEAPRLYPTGIQKSEVENFLGEKGVRTPYIVIAPGTVWPTKRYPIGMMVQVAKKALSKFANVIIIGGQKDIGMETTFVSSDARIVSAIGRFSIMASAELIRRASVLIANDSAPVHIASAFDTPTVAIFGPTVKEFGFFPFHRNSVVVEREHLSCRPCTLHGGRTCPIRTFVCMRSLMPDDILERACELAGRMNA